MAKLDQCSYKINGDFATVARIVRGKFSSFWYFYLKYKTEKSLIYKARDPNGDTVVLGIGPHPKFKHETILATVAFQTGFYGLESSESATDLRARIIRDLSGELKENKPSFSVSQLESSDDKVSMAAYNLAITPTISKLNITREFFRELPMYFKVAIGLTFIAFILITVGWWLRVGGFDTNAYVGSLVLILGMLLFELGIPVWQDWKRKRQEESEDLENA